MDLGSYDSNHRGLNPLSFLNRLKNGLTFSKNQNKNLPLPPRSEKISS